MKIYAIFLPVRVNSYPSSLLSHSPSLTLITFHSNHEIHIIHAQMAAKLLYCVHVELGRKICSKVRKAHTIRDRRKMRYYKGITMSSLEPA